MQKLGRDKYCVCTSFPFQQISVSNGMVYQAVCTFWSTFGIIGHTMPMRISNHTCRKNCVGKKYVHSMFSWVDSLTISSGWTEVELEMDPEMTLTPNQLRLDRCGARHEVDPLSPKARHIWDWNQRWSRPSKDATQIWIQRMIRRWS